MVDGYGGPGRRKLWIVPLLCGLCLVQVSFAVVLLATDGLDAGSTAESMGAALTTLFGAMFLMNVLSATQDIAVDGLAIDLLEENELGIGNTAQVVGFKLGMFTGGPGLRMLTDDRLPFTFIAFACVTALVLLMTALSRELRAHRRLTQDAAACEDGFWKSTSLLASAVWSRRGGVLVVAFVATYKAGEQIADTLFKPFVVDSYSSATALWLSTYSLVPSMAGSVIGGVLVGRHGISRALKWCCIARTISIGLEWTIVMGWLGDSLLPLLSTSWIENMSGGALTTVTFAFMMAVVDSSIAASHYTVLAAVEVFGKLFFGQIAGPLADSGGYAMAFAAAVALSMAHLLFIPFLSSSLPSYSKAESLSD